jgi:hypothetical protein
MSGKTILIIVLIPLALAVPVILVKLVVQDKDPTLPLELLRPYEVVTAEYYGVRLDDKAGPSDTVYVLLRSIDDLYKAAEAPTSKAQIQGVRRQREIEIACAAPKAILNSFRQTGIPIQGDVTEQKVILRTILAWSRALGYYVGGFGLDHRDTWQVSVDRSVPNEPAKATVRFVAKENNFDTEVEVSLAREADRWRIYRVMVSPVMPRIPVPTQPAAVARPSPAASAPAPGAAKPASRSAAVQPRPSTPAPARSTTTQAGKR